MKKLIFGLMAAMLMTSGAFAQTLSDANKKNVVNAQMVTLVNVSKTFYRKGQSYEDFVKALTIPSPTYPSQDQLFRKVYDYVSNNTADCDIMKADNSVLLTFASDISKSPSNAAKPGDPVKKWWQILINTVVNIGIDLLMPINDIDVDLFPTS